MVKANYTEHFNKINHIIKSETGLKIRVMLVNIIAYQTYKARMLIEANSA